MTRGTPAHFYQALNKPFNVLGVERQLFYLFTGLSVLVLISGRLRPIPDVVAVLMFILLHSAGILITRRDSQMLAIYRNHIKYKRYYTAIAGIQ